MSFATQHVIEPDLTIRSKVN